MKLNIFFEYYMLKKQSVAYIEHNLAIVTYIPAKEKLVKHGSSE